MILSRPFYDLERYEREAATRLWPDALLADEIYTLRIRWPAEIQGAPCHEFCVVMQAVVPIEALYKIELAWQPKKDVQLVDFPMNDNAFVVSGAEEGANPYEGAPCREMGYFLGSTDPWDLALAEISEALTPVIA